MIGQMYVVKRKRNVVESNFEINSLARLCTCIAREKMEIFRTFYRTKSITDLEFHFVHRLFIKLRFFNLINYSDKDWY